ncbi:carbohydrate ABC transporter permease [Spirochaeta africana]|uniref:ABC-type sugar transport system, permease component n=1 Tax=Spirochaeta africana (strain ATCC 700263 / DSM 8902 / Z-7692) TaxID=889378 RepID=H9UMS4_SPIAZ|nr:carbohydrate ABC transporter permease [Spirochaeta africana]AFG38817.1 ABC-type sugar transport system, permease component [Spirochaeta africana DSM 8902]
MALDTMTTGYAPEPMRIRSAAELARGRWLRVGIVYSLLLIFAVLFLGPLLFAATSSLKVNALEYPPTLRIPQLHPGNWAAAARLGRQGAGKPFLGGFAPGAEIDFTFEVFTARGLPLEKPEVVIPRRRPGAGLGAVLQIDYAADYAVLDGPWELERRETEIMRDEVAIPGTITTYGFRISYPDDGPRIDRLPVDITLGVGSVAAGAQLAPTRLERRGRVISYDNLAPGWIGYMLRNYVRLFREARDVATGRSLFFSWTMNSGIYALARVISNIMLASMAGYALARFRFRGRSLIFMIVLFSQMVPAQVTFISNYLVIRDGIFGFSRLFGVDTLLNTLTGVIIGGAGSSALIEASKVFIMKQFFESIPHEVEEAALIDGASQWQRYWRVVFPMARPALGAVGILTFQGAWNDFFWPFVVLTSPESIKTLPIGLLSFRQTYGATGDWGLILSGAILSALPVVILFIAFQKYFIQGVSAGGSKG